MSATVRAARPLAPRLATARRHGISRRAERFHVDARAIQRGAQPEAPASLARRYVLLAGAAAGAAAVHGGSPGAAAALGAPPAQGGAAGDAASLGALMDGIEALRAALSIRGSQGGARLRLRNLLPKYSGAVTTMTAYLPAVAAATPAPSEDPGWVAAADNILIGVSQVTAMAGFAGRGEFESFRDADIPFSDIELAVASAQQLLSQVPQQSQDRAMKYRCKTLLNKAADLDEMKDIANSPMCAAAF
eukprot:jgi/Tetstr1/438663/TSEL_027213.t1